MRRRLLNNRDGSVLIEFAILAPVLLGMIFGIFQVGLGMQNYNALRSASADTARFAVVNYQASNNKLTASDIAAKGRSTASNSPYGLIDSRLNVTCVEAGTQRVTGAKELTLTMTYRVPTMLSVLGLPDIPLSYERPIFLLT